VLIGERAKEAAIASGSPISAATASFDVALEAVLRTQLEQPGSDEATDPLRREVRWLTIT